MEVLALPIWRGIPQVLRQSSLRFSAIAWMASVRHSPASNANAKANDAAEQATNKAFYELFARYQKPIADFLFRMTRDADWAADLTQDTFLKAYAHIDELPQITNVRAWLYRIAANTANNSLRHQRRFTWVPLTEVLPGDSNDPRQGIILAASGDLATGVVERDALLTALSKLSPTARSILLLRSTAGFETAEIASMMGLSEANIRKILYRTKEKLRQILGNGTSDIGEEA
jgi:RNA polymerase sigma factor (sigma-70 family)